MKERPTSVTVFAVLNLILTGIGVLGIIHWLVTKMGLLPVAEAQDPVSKAIQESPLMTAFGDIANGIGILTTILMLAASIGMFTLKPWSRLTTIGLGVYGIAMMILGYLLNALFVIRPLMPDLAGGELVIARVILIVGGAFTALFIGYYLLMIFFLTRPHVVDAFTPEPLDEYGAWDQPAQPGGFNQ